MNGIKYSFKEGEQVGSFIFKKFSEKIKGKKPSAVFICRCGKEVELVICKVINGNTKRCSKRKEICPIPAYSSNYFVKKGEPLYKEYQTWHGMRSRCNSEKGAFYYAYGGRGIKVCERWDTSFKNFIEDMGKKPTPKHSIDRIDVNGDYEPSNCRWATNEEQQNNKRDNHYIEINGEVKSLTLWCREYNIPVHRVSSRISKLGWDVIKALTTPSKIKATITKHKPLLDTTLGIYYDSVTEASSVYGITRWKLRSWLRKPYLNKTSLIQV